MTYQRTTLYVKEEDGILMIFEPTGKQEIARHTLSKQKGQIIKNKAHYRDLKELQRLMRLQGHLLKSTSQRPTKRSTESIAIILRPCRYSYCV